MMTATIKTLKNTYKVEEHDGGVIHITDVKANSYISFRDRHHFSEFIEQFKNIVMLPIPADITDRYVGTRGKYDYK